MEDRSRRCGERKGQVSSYRTPRSRRRTHSTAEMKAQKQRQRQEHMHSRKATAIAYRQNKEESLAACETTEYSRRSIAGCFDNSRGNG